METINRREALTAAGAAALLAAGASGASAQQSTGGTSLNPVTQEGVDRKVLNDGNSMIPGYKHVRLLDIVVQPGKSFGPNKMESPMVCHMLDGEMDITQDMGVGTFTAKKNHVWTCNTGMTEGGTNKGSTPATMRIVFLLPT
jgi:hypothetical protein